ncbi:hypothetical protein NEJ07_12530, partial [Staphylococcus aureus]|nr:hypothetical protein [Staphylococcus aureus]
SLKTLYRKRTVIWPFYFYTIIRTLSKYRSHPYNKKVEVIKSKYIYWKNIEITKKGDNKLIKKDKAYTAKLYYNIPNGYKYYSLYDEKNKWMGYFNSNDIKVVK